MKAAGWWTVTLQMVNSVIFQADWRCQTDALFVFCLWKQILNLNLMMSVYENVLLSEIGISWSDS